MNNEITAELTCSINEIKDILENKEFKIVDKYSMDDIYYVPENINICKLPKIKIINSCILLRNIKQYQKDEFVNSYNIIKMTYKHKDIAPNGDIISQDKTECNITDIESGKSFLKAIGYKELMNIKENTVVYENNKLKIAVKQIDNGDNLLEIETNKHYNSVDKLKQEIKKLNIPIDESNFFVKKAERKLKKILGDLK